MSTTNKIISLLDNDAEKTNKILSLIGNTIINSLKTGGINHQNILNVFSKVCKELEFNKKIKNEIISDTGSEKPLIAIKIINYSLKKYLDDFPDKISEKEKQIIEFFLSYEGELILMATTSLIVKAFNHVQESYEYGDINNDGCIFGKNECKRFWKKLFCCIR